MEYLEKRGEIERKKYSLLSYKNFNTIDQSIKEILFRRHKELDDLEKKYTPLLDIEYGELPDEI